MRLDDLPQASEPLSRAEAYRAMLRIFEYYGKFDDGLTTMASDFDLCRWQDGSPADPAAWDLWLEACAGEGSSAGD